jgi:hypothetical protein
MPDIIIRCPITGLAVPTGLTTADVLFESLPNVAVPLRCPSYEGTHDWKPIEAWVKGEKRRRRRPQEKN